MCMNGRLKRSRRSVAMTALFCGCQALGVPRSEFAISLKPSAMPSISYSDFHRARRTGFDGLRSSKRLREETSSADGGIRVEKRAFWSRLGKHHAPEQIQNEHVWPRTVRMLEFWRRALDIYCRYKVEQAKINFRTQFIRDPAVKEKSTQDLWDIVHEINSQKMLQLCLDLRGFYLKAGQFLGSRPDFMPIQYIKKLSTLHDRVPAIPESQIIKVLEAEIGRPISDVFTSIDLTAPVGSASVCQVHEGRLRSNGDKVAVKIQYPKVEQIFRNDLLNLKGLSAYLRKFEVKFDLGSMVTELQKQITQEFDFVAEAKALQAVGPALQKAVPSIVVPHPFYATKRLLIMSFLDGISITRLGEDEARARSMLGSKILGMSRRRFGEKLLKRMADAWGHMLFEGPIFQADPHPGNLLLMKGFKVGVLDWGQTKRLDLAVKRELAKLYIAMAEGDQQKIHTQFYRTGIKTGSQDIPKHTVAMAESMFDVLPLPRFSTDLFSKDHGLNINPIHSFPSELCYVLRTVQIMRGIAKTLDVDFKLSRVWAPLGKQFLEQDKTELVTAGTTSGT